MTTPKAITNSQAIVSMANCDDSIAEIDAMIPRLLRMKKQLIAQKEYIEVALKDANDSGNLNAASAVSSAANQNAKIVDFRANLYKHQQKIQRLNSSTPENGTLVTDDTTDSDRAKKNGGGGGDIFNTSQKAADGIDTQEKQTADIFDGVDLVGTKKFLIGVNAILTQSNDISSNSSATEAITPYNSSSANKGEFNSAYVAGGTHKINEEVLRGLVMQGNKNEKGLADLSEENGLTIREVAGEEIVIDETFAKITQQVNTATNSTSLSIDAGSVSGGTGTTKLTNKLVIENNNVAKIIVTDPGAGYTANDIITIDKNGIPGKSVPVGSTHNTFAGTITYPTEITGVTAEITRTGITATPSTTGFDGSLTVDVTIFNNVITNIIVNTYTAGSNAISSTETFTITASNLQKAFLGSSVTGDTTVVVANKDLLTPKKSINAYTSGNFNTPQPTNANHGAINDLSVTGGSGTGMTLDLTVATTGNVVTEAVIKTTGLGYKVGDILTVDKNLIPGSSLGTTTTKDKFANITQEATDAADQTTNNTPVVYAGDTGSGSDMTVDITITSGEATELNINTTGSGYAVGDELKIAAAQLTNATADLLFTLTAVPGSSDTDLKFTLTAVPGSSDKDLKFKLLKVPGATNTNATTNRGKKIRGFGL